MSRIHDAAVIAATPPASLLRRHPALVTSSFVIAALAGVNVLRYLLPHATLWLSMGAAVALLLFARRRGLTWGQLGLSRRKLRSGAVWALTAIVAVGGVYLAAILLPVTRAVFLDTRYHFGLSEALLTAFIVIPLGTVLLEEVAFRSVLWGVLARHMTTWRVLIVSSTLFGLWHVLPSLKFASAHTAWAEVAPNAKASAIVLVVLGTVAFTAVGGAVAGELRRRSGSVLASAGAHWATNALGVLFAVAAWRIAA